MKPIRLFNFVQMDNGIHWLFLLAVFVSTLLRAFQKAARPLNELARGFPIAGSGPPVVTPVGGRDPERVGNRWRERKKEKLRFDFGIRSMQPWIHLACLVVRKNLLVRPSLSHDRPALPLSPVRQVRQVGRPIASHSNHTPGGKNNDFAKESNIGRTFKFFFLIQFSLCFWKSIDFFLLFASVTCSVNHWNLENENVLSLEEVPNDVKPCVAVSFMSFHKTWPINCLECVYRFRVNRGNCHLKSTWSMSTQFLAPPSERAKGLSCVFCRRYLDFIDLVITFSVS